MVPWNLVAGIGLQSLDVGPERTVISQPEPVSRIFRRFIHFVVVGLPRQQCVPSRSVISLAEWLNTMMNGVY